MVSFLAYFWISMVLSATLISGLSLRATSSTLSRFMLTESFCAFACCGINKPRAYNPITKGIFLLILFIILLFFRFFSPEFEREFTKNIIYIKIHINEYSYIFNQNTTLFNH